MNTLFSITITVLIAAGEDPFLAASLETWEPFEHKGNKDATFPVDTRSWAVMEIESNGALVNVYDEDGRRTQLGRYKVYSYGVYPINIEKKSIRVEVDCYGGMRPWRVVFYPFSAAPTIWVPGSISGTGDSFVVCRGQRSARFLLNRIPNEKDELPSVTGHIVSSGGESFLQAEQYTDIDDSWAMVLIESDGEWELSTWPSRSAQSYPPKESPRRKLIVERPSLGPDKPALRVDASQPDNFDAPEE